jgi:hypothetical protein
VGDSAVAEFANWRRQADLPDPLDVLDGRVKWQPDTSRLDIVFAVTSSATQVVLNEPMDDKDRKRRAIELWKLLGMLAGVAADCAVGQARQLEDANMTYNDLAVDAALVKLYGPMQAAGVLRVG